MLASLIPFTSCPIGGGTRLGHRGGNFRREALALSQDTFSGIGTTTVPIHQMLHGFRWADSRGHAITPVWRLVRGGGPHGKRLAASAIGMIQSKSVRS